MIRFSSPDCCRLTAGRLPRPRRYCEDVIDHSKDELLSFSPGHPDYRYKLWVRVVTPDSVWYHVFWRRIALALALLTLAGWLSAAAGVWAFVKLQRGYTEARYIDLAFYPWRKEDYRTGLGQHYLKTGRAALEKKTTAKVTVFSKPDSLAYPTTSPAAACSPTRRSTSAAPTSL